MDQEKEDSEGVEVEEVLLHPTLMAVVVVDILEGGSYNAGIDQNNFDSLNYRNGYARIFRAEGTDPGIPKITLLDSSWNLKSKNYLIKNLGNEYRVATSEEVAKAREAATPGSVNNWTATRQIKPRNLPGAVNEYGFDVSTTSGTWVVKE